MLQANGQNEIFFVDGAESSLNRLGKDALTSASAHFLEIFDIRHEVDVYVSKRSVLHKIDSRAHAWHMPPSYDRENSIVCVYVDPDTKIEKMIESLAHEMIHVWQVERGDFEGFIWKGRDLTNYPYNLQPWEIEAHSEMRNIANKFFTDDSLSQSEMKSIMDKTDLVFKEIEKEITSNFTKEKLIKIAKVAGAVGLGAIIGM